MDLRLERARHLLLTTNFTIGNVARLSGYNSAPALAKVFDQEFKASPREFRRGEGARRGPAAPPGRPGAARAR